MKPFITILILFAFLRIDAVLAQDFKAFKLATDSLRTDTFPSDSLMPKKKVVIVMSPDSIDSKVEYGSVDSNYLDNSTRKVYLFGDAYVRYKDLSLKADYIVVDLDSSIAFASGLPDSLGELQGNPELTMAGESFTSQRIRYNFKTRKGFIYNVVTEEGDLLIHGAKTKFVAASSDPSRQNDILYNEGALITTCDHPEPHYGIRARKVKTIPDKLAVVGPSHLEIFGVATPLWLPFGFYPVSETRTAGVIFPRDYERSPQWGFGLKEFGYYFPIKEWADARITGDIYFNGSWGVGISSNYLKKYKFRGNLRLGYSNRITEATNSYVESNAKSFSINLSHNQDPKAHPYQNLGGSINIQTNDYQSLNYNDAASVLTTNYSSNFNYTRIFPNKPYSFTAGMNHSQNTQSHIVTITAPDVNFRLNRIYPFKSKKPGPEQWYEKIAFQYSGNGKAQVAGTDTTLFEQDTWDKAQWGAQHRASASTNFSVLKYFNFTPSVDYGETWFFKTRRHKFVFDPNDPQFVRQDTFYFPDSSGFFIVPDTINTGIVNADTLDTGFEAFRTISGSINMNTQIFGLIQFNKGWLRGIRHVIKPNIGFSYAPASPSNYYTKEKFSVAFPDSTKLFNRFENLLFGARPIDQDQALLNYSFTNLFEAKYFSKRDSTEKKLKLFDNISVGGNYNFAARGDSLHFSPINISGNTRLFKGITTVSVGATYSFYDINERGQLVNKFYADTKGHWLRFDNLRLRFSSHITFNDILGLFGKKESRPAERTERAPGQPPALPVGKDKFFDLLSGFSINHEMGIMRFGMPGKDTTIISTHSVNMTGSMKLTPNWSIRFGNIGYDFKSKQLTYPDIGLARDLHCWEMSFNFQPTRGTYSFHIGVKPGSFDFLKFPYKRSNYDTFGF